MPVDDELDALALLEKVAGEKEMIQLALSLDNGLADFCFGRLGRVQNSSFTCWTMVFTSSGVTVRVVSVLSGLPFGPENSVLSTP